MKKCVIAIIAQSVFVIANIHAQGDPNIIHNGGFETGSLTDWTVGPAPGIIDVDKTYDGLGPVVNPMPTTGGTYFAVLSPQGREAASIFQEPAVPAGITQPVTLSFDYDLVGKATAANETPAQQDASLNVTIDGVNVFAETYAKAGGPALKAVGSSGQSGWQTASITLTPTEFNDIETHGADLDFAVNHGQALEPEFDFAAAVDNVSLSYTAPDASSTALLLGGVLFVVGAARRKLAS